MIECIDREALLSQIKSLPTFCGDDPGNYFEPEDVIACIQNIKPVVELPAGVTLGFWLLIPRAYYRDSFYGERELAVYVAAECCYCGRSHPEGDVVYFKTLEAPDGEEFAYRWDLESEKKKALREFRTLPGYANYKFARFCPDCGALMISARSISMGVDIDNLVDVKEIGKNPI